MVNRNIRIVVILAAISIFGTGIFQYIWMKRALDLSKSQFNRSVSIALRGVAEKLLDLQGLPGPDINPVQQLSSNYFVVRINDQIDANILQDLLLQEFMIRNILTDFEYGIYDCYDEKMVYGNYIQLDGKGITINTEKELPVWGNADYYFGVYFPKKKTYVLGQIEIWLYLSLVLFIVILFFIYAVWIILKQRRLSFIQKEFINNMTHEFKTPISTIELSANVIKDPSIVQDPEKLKNYADIISEENLRLKTQVERILQVITLEKSDIVAKPEPVNVENSIRQVLSIMEPLITEKKGGVAIDFQAKNCLIFADDLHFKNVIFNLIDNALKYCKNPPVIKIHTGNINDKIEIRIEDNGIGIDRSQWKKIFEKFYRIPTGDLHNVKGFGLGLHYVSRVVKMLGGKIRVESTPGIGSTFIIDIPTGV